MPKGHVEDTLSKAKFNNTMSYMNGEGHCMTCKKYGSEIIVLSVPQGPILQTLTNDVGEFTASRQRRCQWQDKREDAHDRSILCI